MLISYTFFLATLWLNYSRNTFLPFYHQVASSCIDNQLLRHSAKEHFFRAALCRMCQDMQDGTNAISKYEDMFPAFSDSRECKLLKVGRCAHNARPLSNSLSEFDDCPFCCSAVFVLYLPADELAYVVNRFSV